MTISNMEGYQIFFISSLVFLISIQQTKCEMGKYVMSDGLAASLNTVEIIETIPDYQTVILTHKKTQDSRGQYTKLSFDAFGKKRNIDLRVHEPTLIGDSTPIWLVEHNWLRDELFFRELEKNTLGHEITLYETSEGSIIGSGINENGLPYFMGSVGDFDITPLPSKELNKIRRRERDYSKNESSSDEKDQFKEYNETDYHFIRKKRQSSDDTFQSAIIQTETFDEAFLTQFNNINSSKWEGKNPDNNTTIYPEILLFTDFDLPFIEPGSSEFNDFIIYLIAFWNNVASHFKTLSNPFVSLRIIGIVICMSRKAIPFLNNNVSPDGRIYSSSAMIDMSTWLKTYKHKFPMESYDVAVAMTNRHLCRLDASSGYCRKGRVLGVARPRSKCASNDYPFMMSAIVHDNSNFKGVSIASHELAHLMGARHDGSRKPSAIDCDPNDISPRYIMLPKTKLIQNFIWSNCSQLHISAIWRKNPKNCLTTNSTLDTGKIVSIILPGDLMSLNHQCINRGYSRACETMYDICKNLQCSSDNSTDVQCHKSGPPFDGSNCGPNHHCILGECTPRNEDNMDI